MNRARPSWGGGGGGSLELEEDPGRSSLITEDRFPREGKAKMVSSVLRGERAFIPSGTVRGELQSPSSGG